MDRRPVPCTSPDLIAATKLISEWVMLRNKAGEQSNIRWQFTPWGCEECPWWEDNKKNPEATCILILDLDWICRAAKRSTVHRLCTTATWRSVSAVHRIAAWCAYTNSSRGNAFKECASISSTFYILFSTFPFRFDDSWGTTGQAMPPTEARRNTWACMETFAWGGGSLNDRAFRVITKKDVTHWIKVISHHINVTGPTEINLQDKLQLCHQWKLFVHLQQDCHKTFWNLLCEKVRPSRERKSEIFLPVNVLRLRDLPHYGDKNTF